jgi:hypothetical protein
MADAIRVALRAIKAPAKEFGKVHACILQNVGHTTDWVRVRGVHDTDM